MGTITDSVVSHNSKGLPEGVAGAQARVVAARNRVMKGAIGIMGAGLLCADATRVRGVGTDNVVKGMTESGIPAVPGSTVVASRSTVTNDAVGLADPATGNFFSMQDNVSALNMGNASGTVTPGALR